MPKFYLNKVASSVTIASESVDRDTNLENFGSLANAIAPAKKLYRANLNGHP